MITSLISRLVILTCGTLYPAYRSYKAVKTKSVRDYVKWMMYWIVFALFLCAETVADVFISWWMPFYYEVKIVFVLWLLSPYTKGSSILYRRFVHPMLTERENEIDDVITKAKQEGYRFILRVGSQGLTMLTTLALQLVTQGPSFLDKLRSSFDNERRTRSAVISSQHQRQLQPQHLERHFREDRQMDVSDGREDRQMDVSDGREDLVYGGTREDESEYGVGGGDDVVLPDVPSLERIDDGAIFRVPDVPPSSTAAATSAVSGASRTDRHDSKTRKRSGKSPARAASASRKNTSRKSEELEENINDAPSFPSATFSDDASDLDDYGDESERKSKKRDANANNVKARGRRPAVGGEVARDRSKTKIPKAKSTPKSTTAKEPSSRFEDASGDLDDDVEDDNLVLLSSDDDDVKSVAARKGKTSTTSGARQRRQIKKKTASAMIMNEDSNSLDC